MRIKENKTNKYDEQKTKQYKGKVKYKYFI